MKKPGSEGDSSVPNMETTEESSVPNMETTEESSVPNLETTRDSSVPNMETTRDSSVPNMETTRDSSVPNMETTEESSVPNLETTRDSSVPNMETTEESSVPNMETTEESSVPNLETTRDSSVPNVETTEESSVPNMETTEESSVPNLETTRDSSVPNMETTEESSVPNLETTRDSSVPNVETTEVRLNQQCCSCDTSSSRCWCVDCGEALCDDCVSAHRRVTVTRSHRILNHPPGNVSTPPTKFCRLHPSEPLKLFCRTCFQYTCRDCQLIGHMNHRYLFVSDALNQSKKQLVTWTQPIRAQRDTASRSLKDMQTRLQHIKEGESQLEAELKKSFDICAQLLKRRMDNLMEEVKRELKSESDLIQKQMEKLNQLQKKQILVTESSDEAQNVQDLQSLFRCCTQVKSQLKDLQDQDLSPPETMQLLQVTVERQSLETLLNFGKLEVEKIPFSIPQTSHQNPPPTSTSPTASSMPPSPQTTTTSATVPPISVSGSSVSLQLLSTQLSLLPASGPNLNQPTPPGTTSCAVTHPKHVPLSSSTLESRSPSQRNPKLMMMLNPVSSLVSLKHLTSSSIQSTGKSSCCTVLKPSLVLKQTSVSDQNQPSTALLSSPQIVQQVPCWPHSVSAVMPQFPLMLSQSKANTLPAETSPSNTLIGNDLPKQQNHLGLERNSALLLGRKSVQAESCQASLSQRRRPVCSGEPSQSVGQGHHSLTESSSAPPAQLALMCDTYSNRYEVPFSSSVKQRQIPVVKAVADSACDHTVQQMSTRQEEPPENKPTSTLCEETEPAESRPTSTLCEQTEPAESRPTSTLCEETEPAESRPTSTLCEQTEPAESRPTSTLCEQTEAAENNPTSTVSEETEPAKNRPNFNKPTFIDSERTESTGKPPQTSDRTAEDLSSVMGLHDFCLSKCQPRVSLFRLPLSLLRIAYPKLSSSKLSSPEATDAEELSFETGQQDLGQSRGSLSRRPSSLLPTPRSLPGAVTRDADDEISGEELVEECQSHISDISEDFGDFTEPLSSPESPVTLEIVYCSACGSDNSSIICSSCGRGYHRDCHIPPVGPDMWTEWNCSLCQDLSDPSDPHRSKRPKRPSGPCLSLMDQRRCESLLLHLKVEGCSRLSKVGCVWFRLMLMSERLSLHRPAAYQTPVEFIRDVWSLFKQTPPSQDDLMNLRQSFRNKLMEIFNSELRPTNRKKLDSNQRHPESGSTSESLLKKTRKRLREFLDMRGHPGPKRTKTDKMDV